jgi:cysteine desulfurase
MNSVSRKRIYLDYNATAPLHPAARAAMCAAFNLCGNASSVHAEGQAARALIETARAEVAAFVGVAPKNVIFTSGGTEALNLALTPNFETPDEKQPFDLLLAGAGEHPAVLAGHRFASSQLELAGLTPHGALDLKALNEALSREGAERRRFMLAIQAANNETGVIQPVAAAAEMVHAAGGIVVCDSVQAAGKIDCDAGRMGADAIVVSAHKFGGPQGVGALCLRSDAFCINVPLLRGGGQEKGMRAGTENVAGVAGMSAAITAVKARQAEEAVSLANWRRELEREISHIVPGPVFFGAGEERLPNTTCFALPSIEAQVLLISLDMEGVAVSSGSACSSGKVQPSHVLRAMHVEPDLARGAIRVSLGWDSQQEDCVFFLEVLERTVRRIRSRWDRSAASPNAPEGSGEAWLDSTQNIGGFQPGAL